MRRWRRSHGFAAAGKPVVIEETFPLSCSQEEFEEFIDKSAKDAAGWIGFYWGQSPDELKDSKTIGDVLTRRWLEYFRKKSRRPPARESHRTTETLAIIEAASKN